MFCRHCGNDVLETKICPKCGYDILNDSKFCQFCGSPTQKTELYCPKCKKKLINYSSIILLILLIIVTFGLYFVIDYLFTL